jgi:hypothetical protein
MANPKHVKNTNAKTTISPVMDSVGMALGASGVVEGGAGM